MPIIERNIYNLCLQIINSKKKAFFHPKMSKYTFKNLNLSKETITQTIEDRILVLPQDSPVLRNYHHKIMIFDHPGYKIIDVIMEYFDVKFDLYMLSVNNQVISFYTDSLAFVKQVLKFNFQFLHHQKVYNIHILFCHKTSIELWEVDKSFEEIFMDIINRKMKQIIQDDVSQTTELNLLNFNNDKGITAKGFSLDNLDSLTLRAALRGIAKECKSLNLSSNNLSIFSEWVACFSNITSLNVSYNHFTNINDLTKLDLMNLQNLWLEGNPLCEQETAVSYVRKLKNIFPKLKSLDGIELLGDQNLPLNVVRNYATSPIAQKVVDKFLMLYFTCFDSGDRSRLASFYHKDATLVHHLESQPRFGIPTSMSQYGRLLKNVSQMLKMNGKEMILDHFKGMAEISHDPASFTVDVPFFKKTAFQLVIDGVFRSLEDGDESISDKNLYTFRKTLIFTNNISGYLIQDEILHFAAAPVSFINTAFQKPIRKYTDFTLLYPSEEDIDTVTAAFTHLTKLRTKEAEKRLKLHNWDIRKALAVFSDEYALDRIPKQDFMNGDTDDQNTSAPKEKRARHKKMIDFTRDIDSPD